MKKSAISAVGFEPANWYWIVGGDESKVFSSSSRDYVLPTATAYLEWVSAGGTPTRIASESELGEVLAQYRIRPIPANVLDGFKESHADGVTIQVSAKLLLWIVNKIRVLEGQQPASAAQFKAFVKDQM